jgi:hypothetical protein
MKAYSKNPGLTQSGISPDKVWMAIFGVWLIFLTGVLNPFTGSPGMLQAFQLQRILSSKQTEIDSAENDLIALQDESTRLEKSKLTQEREIRRVLGYASPNELIFDFSGDSTTN